MSMRKCVCAVSELFIALPPSMQACRAAAWLGNVKNLKPIGISLRISRCRMKAWDLIASD